MPATSAGMTERVTARALLRLEIILLDERRHLVDVLVQEAGETLGRILDGHISELLEALARLRHADGLRGRRLDLVAHALWRAGGEEEPVPGRHLIARQRLGDRRHVRDVRDALGRRDGETDE